MRLDFAYFREKEDLSFDDLAGPAKLTKLYDYGHKISKPGRINVSALIKTVYTSRL